MRKQQSKFVFMVALLILFATIKGYQLTFGDAWAKKDEGRPHSKNSDHYDRLAIDLNLFKNGKYLPNTEDHKPLGDFWEFLGGTWGGRWKDGNHYAWSK
jgi:hypothetical protein